MCLVKGERGRANCRAELFEKLNACLEGEIIVGGVEKGSSECVRPLVSS